ncbi:MAG: phenylalanine--tRNA ligase beta subunit-related protein [Bacteroidales bacterium]|nr:phenylalanine--tRNA ligase beta subunit-related protein [Bacteroidales bacterium]
MYSITPSERFRSLCPDYTGVCIEANVTNSPTDSPVSKALWVEIEAAVTALRAAYDPDTIKQCPSIAAIRRAYKAAGKDPSRYRPACEQLARRILQGKSLYAVNTLVDLGNLVSLLSGYSTAALDADKIQGHNIQLDFGQAEEPYEGIGRGPLNIEHLPVYRDEAGAFATPTSDSTRTMVSPDTHHIIFIINGFGGDREAVDRAVTLTKRLLEQYAEGEIIDTIYY